MSAIDWDGMLADLRAKRAAYDDAIQAIEHARQLLPVNGVPVEIPAPGPAAPQVPAAAAPVPTRSTPASARAEASPTARKPCARPGCDEMFRPNKPGVGRPKRFCSEACAKKARAESEERIGATTAINRR